VLIVFNSLPPNENHTDPATLEGTKVVAHGIRDTLTEIWDDALTRRTSLPVLVISCPGFEAAASLASETSIAKRFSESLLTWIRIPAVAASLESPEALISLMPVRQTFVAWLAKHKFDVLAVKPITASGATLDWPLLEFVRQRCQDDPNALSPNKVDSKPRGSFLKTLGLGLGNSKEQRATPSNQPDQDLRPMALEIVPFDGLDGPLTGLYKEGSDSRPCVIPTSDWRQQKYSPQPRDERATGVFYLNRAGIRQWLARIQDTGPLTPLDQWSMKPLMSMATGSREAQLPAFESALSELMLLLKARPISFPPERGVRGFGTKSLNYEVEDLLT
jgi:hypothetical protein